LFDNSLIEADHAQNRIRLFIHDWNRALEEQVEICFVWLMRSLATQAGLTFIPGIWVTLGGKNFIIVGRPEYGMDLLLDQVRHLGGEVRSHNPLVNEQGQVLAQFPNALAAAPLQGVIRLYKWNDKTSLCKAEGSEGLLKEVKIAATWPLEQLTRQRITSLLDACQRLFSRTNCFNLYQGRDEALFRTAIKELVH